MRCLLCSAFSWRLICKNCEAKIETIPKAHNLQELKVISFYDFDDIEPLLHAKYRPFGSYILKNLALKSFRKFFSALELENPAALVPIDDRISTWYSHTAILAKFGAGGVVRARFGVLRARSHDRYAGQTLAFRKSHPRRFVVKSFIEKNAILIDDIMTTGTTLLEAAAALENSGKIVLFAVVLSRAK
ncbi:hypothetical protein FACS189487_04930 [Campylobacterota bacterium]|nr:hypothetical protein FACS189487_04930 [Campylobacterota bacterium]